MPILTQLYTYPIKSCAGLSHTRIELDKRGPIWDRQWMIVDSEGVFLTQRELPQMALIQPLIGNHVLRLSAPGRSDVTVPLEREPGPLRAVTVWKDLCEAWDEGDELAEWLSDYLDVDVRLVRMADNFVRQVDQRYAPPSTQTGFSDGFPLLIVSEASLAELNRRLVERGSSAIPILRFRPNLVVADCEAFAEDAWRTIQIGAVTLHLVKPCARCAITTVDPATGTVPDSAEPLATLNTFRKQGNKVMFAQNALHRAPGVLSVGDPVSVEELLAQSAIG